MVPSEVACLSPCSEIRAKDWSSYLLDWDLCKGLNSNSLATGARFVWKFEHPCSWSEICAKVWTSWLLEWNLCKSLNILAVGVKSVQKFEHPGCWSEICAKVWNPICWSEICAKVWASWLLEWDLCKSLINLAAEVHIWLGKATDICYYFSGNGSRQVCELFSSSSCITFQYKVMCVVSQWCEKQLFIVSFNRHCSEINKLLVVQETIDPVWRMVVFAGSYWDVNKIMNIIMAYNLVNLKHNSCIFSTCDIYYVSDMQNWCKSNMETREENLLVFCCSCTDGIFYNLKMLQRNLD